MADNDTIDDYELVNCVTTGNATQIWEVKRPGASQSLAMKILLPEAFKDSEQRRNLKHEASIGKSLEHPNIIRIQEVKFTRKHGYFIMEYFRGGNVKSMIRNDKPVVQAKAKRIMECLSQALAYMHDKKWIHRDVKPENVLLTKGGEVRLIDFSLTSRAGSAVIHALSKKSNIVIQGTRTYLAPELIRRERLTHSADIYSLGIMLFEMLVGNPPFRNANPNELLMMHVRDQPPNPSEFDDNITPEADKLVQKLLAKKVKDRPATMHEVFAEVRNINFFKADPIETARARLEAYLASDAQQQHERLDSRLDAQRTERGEARPAPKPKPKPKVVLPPEKPAEPQIPASPAAMQPPPGPQPQVGPFPGMGFPGMPPGYPMFPGMPPGYPMQPGMPMNAFGYPGMPPGQIPPGQMPPGYPGMPMPQPGMPIPGQGQPGVPQPGPPQPAPPPPNAASQQPAPPPAAANQPAPAEKKDAPLASIDDLDIE